MADIAKITALDGVTYDLKDTIARSSIAFGQVDSTSTATAFTATIPGIDSYYDGLAIMLKNGVVTSASGFTININGLGAKQSYNNMAAATADTTLFNVNYTMLFVYDSTRVEGGGWICYRGYDANTNTIGYQIRTNSSTRPVADQTGRYRLLFSSADDTKWVPANTTSYTNATAKRDVNQRAINPFGDIVYYGYTTVLASGSNVSTSYQWQQYVITLGYSFNLTGAALVLPFPKPIYVKCAPQADGSAIIDSTTPYVTELPSIGDGKIYIYLGYTYSATQIELKINHPVFYHDGTGIRIWTGGHDKAKVDVTATKEVNGDNYRSDILNGGDGVSIIAEKSDGTPSGQVALTVNYDGIYLNDDNDDPVYIENVKDPTRTYDAANKHYVDTQISGLSIPTKTSDLTNDSGFLTSAVTSFNGSTGAITYTAPVIDVQNEAGTSLVSSGVATIPDQVFYVTITGSGTEASPYVSDKTFAEISAAYSGGMMCVATVGIRVFVLVQINASTAYFGNIHAVQPFTNIDSSRGIYVRDLKITSSNVITLVQSTFFTTNSMPADPSSYTQMLIADPNNRNQSVWGVGVPSTTGTTGQIWKYNASSGTYGSFEWADIPVTSVNGETGEVVLDASDVGALPSNTTYVSTFNGSSGAVTFTETDPTVPAWAKASSKPTYTAAEVGALPDSTVIPSAVTNMYTGDALSGDVMLYNVHTTSSTVTSTKTCGALTFSSSGELQIGRAHSDEGAQGSISLSNSGGTPKGYSKIIPTATSSATISLPSSTGTLALTSQLPTVPTTVSSFTNDAGFITANDVPQEVFVVTVEGHNSNGYVYTKDKTFAEITAAILANKACLLVLKDYNAGSTIQRTEVFSAFHISSLTGTPTQVWFTKVYTNGDRSINTTKFTIKSDETVTYTSGSILITDTYGASSTYAMSGVAVASAVSGKQDVSNLVTSVSSTSTDSQYPSAKLFYDTVGNIESLLSAI